MVIELPATVRAYVVAGPGAGKTWTLLRRAVNLTEAHGLQTADLVVLSFTRAVVAELRRRDRALVGPSRIRPETFDSFATRLLGEHADNDSWMTAGFDGRIEAAVHLIERDAARPSVESVRHILLDEVQDLVGVRALFVAALLRAHDGGFTAFGDPAQAIYDHERGRHGESLLDLLGGELSHATYELHGNHRASGRLAAVAERLRTSLLVDGSEAADAVLGAFADLDTLGASNELGPRLKPQRRSTAVLCRDNATALLLSDAFHRDAVRHRVRRGTSDRPVGGWVAALFTGRASLTHAALTARHTELVSRGFPGLPDPEFAWQALSRMDRGARGGAVRESEIRTRIAIGATPWELYDEPPERLILSSIHRAKGLEFDECVIVEWSPREEDDELLEARVMFVALTRARQECWHAQGRRRRRWYRAVDAYDRFIKYGREPWQTFGMEIRGGDVYGYEPGGELMVDRSALEVQHVLTEKVRPGDEIVLEYLAEHDYGRGLRPMYAVMHASQGVLGVTGSELGDALRRRLRKYRPARVTDVRVDDLETVAGSPDVGEAAGLGRTGLWLRPRLVGLGSFEWKK